ncbi:MAG: glutathione S-transferase [Azospirillaceae bacterium]|nr:glutathione S-transferase [Azospirillaceae bacterium]
MLKIYDRTGLPNPARIRIVLAEKGLEDSVTFESVDIIAAEHRSDAFLAMNPGGTIPVLELEDGTHIGECTAITEYLDNLDGDPRLTGRTPREKALIHMMQRRAEAEVLDPIGIFFHHATPGLGTANLPFKSPEWAGRAEWGQRNRDRALRGLAYFDGVLKDRPFLAGDRHSMADITLYAGLLFGAPVGIGIAADQGHLQAWRDRFEALPAVKNRGGQEWRLEDLKRLGLA